MSLLIFGLIAFLGFTVLSKNYFSFQPEGKRYEANAHAIQDFLSQMQPNLVAFTEDEFELISGNKQKEKRKSVFNQQIEGILLSIYHEPFLAYKKIYHDVNKKTGVIGVATAQSQLVYVMKKDHTDVFLNKKPIATIKGAGKLINLSDRVVMGSYELKNDASYLVRIFDAPAAEVKLNIAHNSLPQRIIDVYGLPKDQDQLTARNILIFYLIGLGAD